MVTHPLPDVDLKTAISEAGWRLDTIALYADGTYQFLKEGEAFDVSKGPIRRVRFIAIRDTILTVDKEFECKSCGHKQQEFKENPILTHNISINTFNDSFVIKRRQE